MRKSYGLAALLKSLGVAFAASTSRNPVQRVGILYEPTILTPSHRVTAYSSFEVGFALHNDHIRLTLEPNHDLFVDDATVTYLGPDGHPVRSEPLQRPEHKVFKGHAKLKQLDGSWTNMGTARLTVRRDGSRPLFEGAFRINNDNHHVQLNSNFLKTKHENDPHVPLTIHDDGGDDFMVVWRDSDISVYSDGRSELRKRTPSEFACQADSLEFNQSPEHPVYVKMHRRDDSFWSAPMSSLLGKRQLDPSTGGNSAGVNLVQSIGNTAGCPTARKIALVGVATDCTYTGAFNSTESARQNVITQMNSASDLYERTFNISLGLANLTVSDANCPGSPQQATPWNQACAPNIDIQQRLNLFSQWRGERQDKNSHWTLLSTCNSGSAVGLAWLGQACTNGSQANNNTGQGAETVAGANVVVRTSAEWQVIAHETGHTFGAVHDCTSDTCGNSNAVSAQQCCPLSAGTCDAGERFIMNPSSARGITSFSACSIGNICSAFLRNSVKSTCFTNNRDVPTISGQQCGNGIVEDGEDCDCGGESGCGNNQCCDARTCKFKTGAVCDDGNEDCCRNCQFSPSSQVCRPSTGVCDPEERCTGNTPYCPEDKTSPDGNDCGNGLRCASGQCTSRDTQCKTVMGSYTQGNDTYACDTGGCMLSCASPEFGRGVCYGLQQNFLDGTDCGGGGRCNNGVCSGSSFLPEVGSWIERNRGLVIGIGAGVGGLLFLAFLSCLWQCFRRRQRRRRFARRNVPHNAASSVAGSVWPAASARTGPGRRGLGSFANRNDSAQGPLMAQQQPPAGSSWYGPSPSGPPPAYIRNQSTRYA